MLHSIIIPTYGREDLLMACVSSLRKFETGNNYEVIVVDDGSKNPDQMSIARYCDKMGVRFILKHQNEGFAAAVNTGLREACGDIVTLVNNDIIFLHPFLSRLEETFDGDKAIGIVGALLLYPNRKVQHAGLHFSEASGRFLHSYKNYLPNSPLVANPRFVIAVTGALFSMRKELLTDIGYFNENYFLACEDTEYCLRAQKEGYKVLYTPKIQAIHAEGGTRGNTPHAKRLKDPKWQAKEIDSINKFQEDLKTYNVVQMQKSLPELPIPKKHFPKVNGVPKKLEVGSGYNPHPGYIHLDIRPGLPGLDKVCDFAKERLPFKEASFSEILANHVIEHIPWRKLPHVVGEWARTLVPGGKLVLRTPDLEFIVRTYLEGQKTPEHPNDEGFITTHLCSEITPAWWANIKLFSGQDYAANFHHVCFDFNMLESLLRRFHFTDVKRVKMDREFSPGELQVEAIRM